MLRGPMFLLLPATDAAVPDSIGHIGDATPGCLHASFWRPKTAFEALDRRWIAVVRHGFNASADDTRPAKSERLTNVQCVQLGVGQALSRAKKSLTFADADIISLPANTSAALAREIKKFGFAGSLFSRLPAANAAYEG